MHKSIAILLWWSFAWLMTPLLLRGQSKPAFDIRDYGCLADVAVVADNQPCIQNAITAAANAVAMKYGGQQEQTVLCPAGPDVYYIGKPLVIHSSWIKLAGDARGACNIAYGFHGPGMVAGPLDAKYTAFPVTNARSIATGGNSYPISSTGDSNGNQYWMELDDSQIVNLNGLSGFTIDFWFYLTSTPADNFEFFGGAEIADNDSSSNVTADAYFLGGALTGRLTVGGTLKSVGIGTPSLNAWHHFAMTWDGSNLRGFLDGTLTGTTAAAGAITWPTRSSLLFGIGNPILWPDSGGNNPSPNGNLDALRISNLARWTANFSPGTPPISKPVADANTLMLCNFDNQYDIFTGCSGSDSRTSWLPVHRSLGGSSLINNVTLANITINAKQQGDGIWIYGVTDSKFENIITSFARDGMRFWGGSTFQNRVYDAYLGIGGSNSRFCILGASGALGLTTFFKPHCITNAAFPFYWQVGSTVWIHPETSPNQGVVTNFYFDCAGCGGNMTTTMIGGGADTEVANTAFVSDLTLKGVQTFTMIGGSMGAGAFTVAPVKVIGGGAIEFSGTNFVLNSSAPSAVRIVSNPSQPVVFDNTIQQGGTNIPWVDVVGQGIALNNAVTNCTNLNFCLDKKGRITLGGSQLVAADFAVDPKWGATASIAALAGTDSSFSVQVVSAGTGQAASPTLVLTFHDGTWNGNSPQGICSRVDSSAPTGNSFSVSTSATSLTITFWGTPVAGNNYQFTCHVDGRRQ